MATLIKNNCKTARLNSRWLKRIAQKILKTVDLDECELSVLITGDDEIAQLNERWLGRKGPTDVISFSMRDGEDAALNPTLLGDLVISAETAQKNANERGRTLEQEMVSLLIHGILHLCGYDHERSPREARRMREEEKNLLEAIKD